MTETNPEKDQTQLNIENHEQTQFQEIAKDGLINGGVHVVASKGHGKTRLLFSIADYLRTLPSVKVYIFDGSEAWLYGYSKIAVFNVHEEDITATEQKTVEDIEKYQLRNPNLLKLALETEKDLLFRLKTKKPSKRGFFIRQVINYLDSQQRTIRETTANHEPKETLAFIIEESQDAFNIRSTLRTDSEEFLTTFNEARNQKIAFYTASQRLNDFSKTIRTKQNYVIGKINIEDRTPAIKQIERQNKIDFSTLPLRNWVYEGQQFKSPEFKQVGKPYKINRTIRAKYFNGEQPKPKMGLIKALATWFFSVPTTNSKETPEKADPDESELDLFMTSNEKGSEMFPTDHPEEF